MAPSHLRYWTEIPGCPISSESKDATGIFAEGADGEKSFDERQAAGEPLWPFPKDAPTEAPPPHMREPKVSKKARKALGAP